MKEFIIANFDSVFYAACGLLALITGSEIFSLVKTLSLKAALKKQLENAKEKEVSTVCPHCRKKLYFKDLKWTLPDGRDDNNLNGKADDEE